MSRVTVDVELERVRREELQRSLQNPHPESAGFSDRAFEDWMRSLPSEDAAALVDGSAGTPARWIPGEGWREGSE